MFIPRDLDATPSLQAMFDPYQELINKLSYSNCTEETLENIASYGMLVLPSLLRSFQGNNDRMRGAAADVMKRIIRREPDQAKQARMIRDILQCLAPYLDDKHAATPVNLHGYNRTLETINLLGELKDTSVVPYLEKVLDASYHPILRQNAYVALKKISGNAIHRTPILRGKTVGRTYR